MLRGRNAWGGDQDETKEEGEGGKETAVRGTRSNGETAILRT